LVVAVWIVVESGKEAGATKKKKRANADADADAERVAAGAQASPPRKLHFSKMLVAPRRRHASRSLPYFTHVLPPVTTTSSEPAAKSHSSLRPAP